MFIVIQLFIVLISLIVNGETFTATYLVNGKSYSCSESVNPNYLFEGKCANGKKMEIKKGSTIKYSKGNAENWKTICTQACIEATVNQIYPGLGCAGFYRTSNTQCVLVFCDSGVKPGDITPRGPAPTGSPTKRPTEAPIPFCYLASTNSPAQRTGTKTPTTVWVNLEGHPSGRASFVPWIPDPKLCMVIRNKGGASFSLQENFDPARGCSLDACVRRCFYDNGCLYAQYSPIKKICITSNAMELTDDIQTFQEYQTSQTVTYRRKNAREDYYSGACNELTPKTCRGECGWRKGKIGYNNPVLGGGAGGWCGRTKCSAGSIFG